MVFMKEYSHIYGRRVKYEMAIGSALLKHSPYSEG